MKKTDYDNWIKIISVLMAVVLVLGAVLSLVNRAELKPVNKTDEKLEENGFVSMVDVTTPESYSSLLEAVVTLRSEYSESLKCFTLGTTATGKAIPMVTMGSGEKKALVVGGLHAREHLTTKYLLRVIEEYCFANEKGDGKYGDYDIKALLSEYTVYIVPCLNPDGLDIVLSKLSVKDGVYVDVLSEYKANYNGVDLNRNFPLAWELRNNGTKRPAGYFFKGYEAASENETKAIMKLCEDNNFSFMLSIHVRGNCIYWADEYNTKNNGFYKIFAQDIALAGGLSLNPPTKSVEDYGGGFENWFRHQYSKPGLCVELVKLEHTIKPCTDENYRDFHTTVNFNQSRFIIGAALSSEVIE